MLRTSHIAGPAARRQHLSVCGWQDDYVDNQGTDALGPNRVPLPRAKQNFVVYGVSDLRLRDQVRPPRPDELPEA
jgi:hypothetical protein